MMKKVVIICLILLPILVFAQDRGVSRHQFTSSVESREPVDMLLRFTPTPSSRLYYYTELTDMDGVDVIHVWYINDEMVYQMPIVAEGARWRTYSTMNAPHFKFGDRVTVEVVGADGVVYAKDRIIVE